MKSFDLIEPATLDEAVALLDARRSRDPDRRGSCRRSSHANPAKDRLRCYRS